MMRFMAHLLMVLVALASARFASAGPIGSRGLGSTGALESIFLRASSTDPFVQEGCKLTNSSNPDPRPANRNLISTGAPTPISDDLRARVNAFSPYAAAVYCPSFQAGTTTGCGRPCNDLAGVEAVYQTGDGSATPHAVITYAPNNRTLTIAHEGTNFTHLLSILNDLVLLPVAPPTSITNVLGRYSSSASNVSPGPLSNNVNSSVATTNGELILVHAGILGAWSRGYDGILAAVQRAIQTYPDLERIWVTGHSLGASVATLDMIALRGAIDTRIQIEGLIFASLRVGNPIFAKLVDQLVSDPSQNLRFSHVVNSNDVIPHLGPLIIGYQHPFNEVFLPVNGSDQAVLCPGEENIQCALGRSLQTSIAYHSGPYVSYLWVSRSGHQR